ncbi:SURF1 family cytochrome oxidase biogenesis protein [Streptomyces sp. NPDC008139]|uniref:SURF1 family cytochrome oxidase biogenesis protein n=1 Tax=Streptomyces sp. NPDC008139 TaxID=3364814 RepID=UPI0036E5EC7A
MYRFLWSRQWVILTLLGLVMMPTMVRLGFWQLHRHEHRVANNKIIAASLKAAPVEVESVTHPGAVLPKTDLYKSVTATGHFDTAHEVVARHRTAGNDGSDDTSGGGQEVGYHVITPLVLADGRAVLVNRGWISPGNDPTAFPKITPPPSGEVTVTGRLRPDETTSSTGIRNRSGLPDRQIMLISSTVDAKYMPHTLLSGYMELVSITPKPGPHQPALIPEPDHSSIGPHMAYAIQWWLFTGMVPVGWVVLMRRERAERLAAREKQDNPESPQEPEGSVPVAV